MLSCTNSILPRTTFHLTASHILLPLLPLFWTFSLYFLLLKAYDNSTSSSRPRRTPPLRLWAHNDTWGKPKIQFFDCCVTWLTDHVGVPPWLTSLLWSRCNQPSRSTRQSTGAAVEFSLHCSSVKPSLSMNSNSSHQFLL